MKRRIGLALCILLVMLAGCGLGGRGCRGADPPAPTVTVRPPPATGASPSPQEATSTVVLTVTRHLPTPTGTATSTRPILTATRAAGTDVPGPTATVMATATPELVGAHRVAAGETMWGIGLMWYAGRYFAWGEDVWRPICRANPEIGNCRLIYPGDVLRIPRLP